MRADQIARGWVGTPYQHQGSRKGVGTDCLGLIVGVWRELVGTLPVEVPNYTSDWAEARAEDVLWRSAREHLIEVEDGIDRAGRVLLFRMRSGMAAKHLAIAGRTGAGSSFIHAYQGHGVVENALTPPWKRRIVARFEFPVRRD